MQRISGFASRYFLMGRSRLRPILVGGDLTLRAEGETDGISGRNFAELLVHPADLGGNRGVLVNQDKHLPWLESRPGGRSGASYQ